MKACYIIWTAFAIFGLAYGQECRRGEFTCDNGRCISDRWVCDGANDCGDMSDEPDVCPPCGGQFECENGRCITWAWVCDGANDCGDSSDEGLDPDECPVCGPREFRCRSGRCIDERWVCDSDNDCGDWSDETEDTCPCGDDQYRCPAPPGENMRPGPCIPSQFICDPDGIWDCADGSDEANCTRSVDFQRSRKFRLTKLGKAKH